MDATRRVLIVEDDQATRELLAYLMADDGHEVAAVEDGAAALARSAAFRPDLAIVDLALPGGLSGFDVVRRLRASGDVGVLVVTGSQEPADEQGAFALGADDYVTKPFDPGAVVARVRAILRRMGRSTDQVWRVGDLTVDDERHQVIRGNHQLQLTPTEYALLAVLVRQRMRPTSRDHLVREVWGSDYVGDGHERHLVEVQMHNLRRKLDAHGDPIIETVRGLGYVLRAEYS